MPEISSDFEEVLQLCKDINVNKSSGIKNISSRILKDAFMVLITQLIYLINTSLATCIYFPLHGKMLVVPIFKGGDRERVSNYRPISLLPLPNKLIEKVVHTKMTGFFENNRILTNKIGGFRPNHSTTMTIADLRIDYCGWRPIL